MPGIKHGNKSTAKAAFRNLTGPHETALRGTRITLKNTPPSFSPQLRPEASIRDPVGKTEAEKSKKLKVV